VEYNVVMNARWLMLVSSAVWVASCGFPQGLTATFQPGVEALPGPGYFHLIAEPDRAESAIDIRSVGSDGVESRVVNSFQSGEVVEVDGTAFPGPRGLTVAGVECEGRFQVVQEMVTEVVLHMREDGCELTVVRIHAIDQPQVE
jgi:hypothetical protein